MSLLELPAALETFDYTRVGEHGALLRVLTRLSPELGEPAEVQLRVSRSDRPWQSFPARGCRTEADLHGGGDWSGGVCSRSRSALVQQPQFGFELAGPGLPSLSLPRPALRGALTVVAAGVTGSLPRAGRGSLPTTTQLSADQVASVTGGRLRTRAVALATALAVTATSTPALALADGGLISGSHALSPSIGSSVWPTSPPQRARAEAARKQRRSSSGQSSASRSRRAQRHRGALAAPVRAPGTSTRPARGQRHLTKTASGPRSAAQCLPANSGQAANAAPGGKGKAGQQLGSLAPASAQARCAAPAPTQTPAPEPTTTTRRRRPRPRRAPPTATTTTAARRRPGWPRATTTTAAPTTTTTAARPDHDSAPTTTPPATSGGAAVGTTGASGPTAARPDSDPVSRRRHRRC